MKRIKILRVTAYLALLIYGLIQVNNFLYNLSEKSEMLLCYDAGANNYIPFVINYKCALVPRGKGY